MKQGTTIAVGMCLVFGAATAFAQDWGRPQTPKSGACFYEDIRYGGRYFCTSVGGATAEVPHGTNDKISSVRIFGNAQVVMFRDVNFRGESNVVVASVADLRQMGWNDKISSYRVRGFGNSAGNGGGKPSSGSRWTYPQAENMVRRGFKSVLNRDPDSSGLRSWAERVMENNWTQQNLERELMNTDEYRQAHRR